MHASTSSASMPGNSLVAAYQPVAEQRETARVRLAEATTRLEAHDRRAVELRDYRAHDTALDQAITTWRSWAAGRTVTAADHDQASHHLARHADTVPEARALLTALAADHPALQPVRQIDRADVDYGIDL